MSISDSLTSQTCRQNIESKNETKDGRKPDEAKEKKDGGDKEVVAKATEQPKDGKGSKAHTNPILKLIDMGKRVDKQKPPKLAPLKEAQPIKKGAKDSSARSYYNTNMTEHFENAQISHLQPFVPINLAAAFAPPQDQSTTQQRSTEEMRGDTLYKVLDDFPDLIMPPLTNIDRTLPYLRELDVQGTPSCSPAQAGKGALKKLKSLLTIKPLTSEVEIIAKARTPVKKTASIYDSKLLRQTQTDDEGDSPASRALMTNVMPVPHLRGSDEQEVTPREPEPAPSLPAAQLVAKPQPSATKVRNATAAAPAPPRRRTTMRDRIKNKIKKLITSSQEAVEPEKAK